MPLTAKDKSKGKFTMEVRVELSILIWGLWCTFFVVLNAINLVKISFKQCSVKIVTIMANFLIATFWQCCNIKSDNFILSCLEKGRLLHATEQMYFN